MHQHKESNREKNIKIAVFLNLGFTVFEIIGGLWANSLAILSDALHDFGDSIALITSFIAEKKAKQPADAKRTYGYQRLSLFSAVFAAVVLVSGSLLILTRAIPRLFFPEHSNATGMMALAVVGIIVNSLAMWRLKQGQSQNEKVLTWHMIEDVLGWLVIFIGGGLIYFWDNHLIDPIMTIGFTLFVLWGVIKNLKNTLNILMQGVPEHINLAKIKGALLALKSVEKVHDIHVWSLEGETDVFSGHIVVNEAVLADPELINNLKKRIKRVLKNLHIEHSTIEFEAKGLCAGPNCQEALYQASQA